MESAMAMAWAAAQNKTILEKGIVLQGTDKQKEMLLLAIVAANKILPPEQQLSVKNPVHYNTINMPDFQSYIDKNVSGLTSPTPVQTSGATSKDDNIITSPTHPVDPNAKPASIDIDALKLQARIRGIQVRLAGQGEEKLRSAVLAGTRATNQNQNVYSTEYSKGVDVFYVIKDQKPVIIRLDEKGSTTFRHDTIRMKNDEGHPKYKAPKVITPDFVKAAEKLDLPIFKLGKPAFDMPEATQNKVTEYSPDLVVKREMPKPKDFSTTPLMTLGQAFPKSPVVPPEISGQSHMPIVRENAFAKALQQSFYVVGDKTYALPSAVQKLSEAAGEKPINLTIRPL